MRACVEAVKRGGERLDAIICNAGIMALPKLEQVHGIELQFFTNHIGHFMLVTGLLDRLADDGRVVMLSSGAHTMAPREGIRFDDLAGARGLHAVGRTTASRSWPTCSSPRSSRAAWPGPGGPPTPSTPA